MHGTKADKLYDSAKLLDVKAQLDLGECGVQEVTFYHEHRSSVDFVFVDHPVYHRAGAPLESAPSRCFSCHGPSKLVQATYFHLGWRAVWL